MKNATDQTLAINADYQQFIEELKARVIAARISAARAMNNDAILLNWDIGRGIVEKQKIHGWGDSVVEMVAADLRRAFPESKSFSPDNVWRMRQFYLAYATSEFLGQLSQKRFPMAWPAAHRQFWDRLFQNCVQAPSNRPPTPRASF